MAAAGEIVASCNAMHAAEGIPAAPLLLAASKVARWLPVAAVQAAFAVCP